MVGLTGNRPFFVDINLTAVTSIIVEVCIKIFKFAIKPGQKNREFGQ